MESPAGSTTGARFLLIAACLIVVVAGVKAASDLMVPFLSALFLAMITLPLLNWLRGRRIPTPLAVVITLVAALSVLAAVAIVVGGSISGFTAEVPKYQERLNEMTKEVFAWFEAHGIDLSSQLTTDLVNPADAFGVAAGALRGVASVLSNFFLVLLTVIFILFEAAGFPDKLAAAFGSQSGSKRFERIKFEVQRYLGIKTLVSLATGVLISIALAVIGVDFALLWGMLAFLLNYIPNLGSIIAAVPPVLLAVVQLGFGSAIAVAVVFIVANIALGTFIEPQLMGRRLGLSTLVVFLSLVFWGWIWGPMGMLLSVPLTMIVKIMLENTEDLRWIAVLLGPAGKPPQQQS